MWGTQTSSYWLERTEPLAQLRGLIWRKQQVCVFMVGGFLALLALYEFFVYSRENLLISILLGHV